MKKLLIMLCCALGAAAAQADTVFGGQPRITLEYEHERGVDGTVNRAYSVFPGIQWKENDPNRPLGLITRAELYLEGNQDNLSYGTQHAGATGKTTEVKTGLRLRTDGTFDKTWGYFVRGMVGQSFNNERNFGFWYIEPGLKTKFNETWSWTTSYRVVRTFDRDAKTADRNKLRIGPNVDFDKNNGMEFRYVLATSSQENSASVYENRLKSRAWVVEYIHKF